MKKFILAGIVALVFSNLQAEPTIYKLSLTQTRTGAGATIKTHYTGYLVSDYIPDVTNQFALVLANKETKHYATYAPSEWEAGTVVAARGTVAFIQIMGNEDFSGLRLKGANSVTTAAAPIPRSLKATGSLMFGLGEGSLFHIDEFSGSATLDSKKTADYKSMSLNFSGAIGLLETDLLGKGYLP